jgi:OmcA/MtrC family decaheme c-type cytochrome
VQFSVTDPTNGDAPYDIENDPAFTQGAGASRLSVDIGWSTTDFGNVGSGVNPGLPIQIDPLFGKATNVGGNIFEVTSPTAIPDGTSGSLAVAIEGHPAVDIDGDITRIAVTNAIAYYGVTDDPAVKRRNVVNVAKCNDCHKNLSLHGNNRTNKPEVCAICHNGNATDILRRVDASECVNELGADDAPIDFKRMIHQLHASGEVGAVGICGFGNSAHSYDFGYPGHLNDCEGCHNPGDYYPVDPGTLNATTVDANDPAIQSDDVAISPNASVCSSCHVSELARAHMTQNGGDFAAGKAADGTMISAGVETCALCHGEGRNADVYEVHGVGQFIYNEPRD